VRYVQHFAGSRIGQKAAIESTVLRHQTIHSQRGTLYSLYSPDPESLRSGLCTSVASCAVQMCRQRTGHTPLVALTKGQRKAFQNKPVWEGACQKLKSGSSAGLSKGRSKVNVTPQVEDPMTFGLWTWTETGMSRSLEAQIPDLEWFCLSTRMKHCHRPVTRIHENIGLWRLFSSLFGSKKVFSSILVVYHWGNVCFLIHRFHCQGEEHKTKCARRLCAPGQPLPDKER
jgi:hypothetical protein